MSAKFKVWSFFVASLVGIFSFHGLCYSDQAARNYAFIRNGTEAPTVSYYNYIIIGGGTAGCPLATTLSQTSKVLLLERGGSPHRNNNISNLSHLMDNLCDLSPNSPTQHFVSEDGVTNARARVLGGGTCINAGFYSRASQDYVFKAGWDENLVKQSYRWVEELLIQEPELLQWQSAVRDGLVEAGVMPYNGFTYDHLIGTKIGGTTFDEGGHRHTAADLLEQANPDKITVFLHATVHRILFKHKVKPRPVSYGVVFEDSKGRVHEAHLSNGLKSEIILSAGAIGSPQLLMLSGVGPGHHLRSLGIEVVMEQPMVGQGMSDNPMNIIYIPSPLPVEISTVQPVGITWFGSYIESVGGAKYFLCPSSTRGSQSRSLGMCLPQTFHIYPTQMSTPRAAEALNILQNSFKGGFILGKVANPLSVGHLKLLDRNPDNNPSVTFNYFNEPKDLHVCIEGLKTIERVIQSKAFSPFRYSSMSIDSLLNITLNYLGIMPSRRHQNYPESLEQYCKDTVMTIWHYHGGCQVGRVVDHDYRVLGIDALRVIDGSTFITSPGTNPQATLMMLGRYMGIKIQKERLDMEGAW